MKKKKANPDCTLCQSPFCDAATVMREMQATEQEISDHCGVDLATVEQHFRLCASTDPDDGAEASATGHLSDRKLQRLIDDATRTYKSAQALGNFVASSAALGVRLRGLIEQARRQELRKQQEKEKQASNSDGWTIEAMDKLIEAGELARPEQEAAEQARIEESRRTLKESINLRVATQKAVQA